MGAQTLPVPAVILPTRRTIAFTSSTTWTVPSSAQFVDVMVVGGGQGGKGGIRQPSNGYDGGTGGAITIAQNLYLGGTGTVAITVGAGTSGTAGVATTGPSTNASSAGNSLFGTFVASQGGAQHGNPSAPGYRGSVNGPYRGGDTTLSNFTPVLQSGMYTGSGFAVDAPSNTNLGYNSLSINNAPSFGYSSDATFWGFQGGATGPEGASGGGYGGTQQNAALRLGTFSMNRTPWGSHLLFTIGSATAGTNASSGASGGAAGLSGYSGGGGPAGNASNANGAPGGPGAGGGGGNGNGSGGVVGGNGGNAGTNSGSGGGAGGCTGITSAGTGGNGGNGAAGFIIVSYIGTN